MNTEVTWTLPEVKKVMADHDGSRRQQVKFCPQCHIRHPCLVFDLAQDLAIMLERHE